MTINELLSYFKKFPEDHVFPYGLSEPFSWRGSYDEVAFSFIRKQTTAKDIVDNIRSALEEAFTGYKGGQYYYNTNTEIHFEESIKGYSDGDYLINFMLENSFP